MGFLDRLLNLNFRDTFRLPNRLTRDLTIGLLVGITVSLSSTSLALLAQGWRRRRAISRIPPRPIELRSDEIVDGVIGLIGRSPWTLVTTGADEQGNTPLIRINSLSDALGVEILVSLGMIRVLLTDHLVGQSRSPSRSCSRQS